MTETDQSESEGLKVTDNRKIDPETGAPREQDSAGAPGSEAGDPVAELTADLQRLTAEYANYRKRVDRDRELVRDQIISGVLAELFPVLDDIGRARSHGELEGGFKSVGESIENTVARLGLKKFGEPGDEFDPLRHEAIAHEYSEEVTTATCIAVFQPGYEFAGRVVRAAIVSVADPANASADA
jgi:molecular chaperone GrpE